MKSFVLLLIVFVWYKTASFVIAERELITKERYFMGLYASGDIKIFKCLDWQEKYCKQMYQEAKEKSHNVTHHNPTCKFVHTLENLKSYAKSTKVLSVSEAEDLFKQNAQFTCYFVIDLPLLSRRKISIQCTNKCGSGFKSKNFPKGLYGFRGFDSDQCLCISKLPFESPRHIM